MLVELRPTYEFISGPSHGWLKVQKSHIFFLGAESLISGHSYQSRNGYYAYLECDCDAAAFLAVAADNGWDWDIRVRRIDNEEAIRFSPLFCPERSSLGLKGNSELESLWARENALSDKLIGRVMA